MLMADEMVTCRFSCATCSKLLSPLPAAQVSRLQRCIDEVRDESSIERMLRQVLGRLVKLAAADICSVLIPIGQGALRVFASSEPRQLGDVILSLDLYPELAHLLRAEEPILIADTATDELVRPVRHLLRHVGVTSIAAVPFHLAEATAVLRIVSRERPFSPRDLHLLGTAAHLIEHRLEALTRQEWEDSSSRQLVLQLADAVLDLTVDGRVVAVQGPVRERFRVEPEALVGRFLDELLEDLYSGEGRRRLIGLLDGGTGRNGARFLARLAGRAPVPVQVWGSRLAGNSLRVRLLIRRLDDDEAMAGLLEQVPVPVLAIDRLGNTIANLNHAAEQLIGLPASQLIGRSFASLVQGNGELNRLLQPGATAIPVRVERDDTMGATDQSSLVALIDLRDRPESQQREAQLRSTLQRQLADMERMQQRVGELEALRTQFLVSSAHELKTPITVIQSYLEILLEDLAEGLSEQQLSFLQVTFESVQRLRRLVNDLIDLAALEGGKLQLDICRIKVLPVVLPVIEEMQQLARRAGVSLRHEGLEVLPPLRADGMRVQQVLRNLIDNAIRSTPVDGQILIRGYAEGDSVVLEVHDSGVGIPAERLANLFDEFTSAGPTRDRSRSGSGLSLAISRRIVQTLGGRLSVTSEEDKGAVFSAHLPQWPGDETNPELHL